ncbi:MAG: ABC transporter ATP-binding protein [Bacillota bacterium]|nr:ABC transporter ATP-binding protein [Bacillota bacterium]
MTGEKTMLVETENLTKRYGDLTAVDSLNLKVKEGAIFGLLGPNGAGKTTTILMLLGLTEPSSGRALVSGYDATRNPLQVKAITGYLPDNVGFYQDMTGRENLRYTASLNGFKGSLAEEKIEQALVKVGLREKADKKVGEYSRGMKQRLGIADVLVKEPQLIIMDEPTLAIDPKGVQEILGIIKDLAKKDGKTILISSHLLHQIQEVCDEVGIFVKGKLIAVGPIAALGEQLIKDKSLEIELSAYPNGEMLLNVIRKFDEISSVDHEGDMLILECREDIRDRLSKSLLENNFSIRHLSLRGISLDSIYRQYFQGEVQ